MGGTRSRSVAQGGDRDLATGPTQSTHLATIEHMRYGIALDLHATAVGAAEVSWPAVRSLALAAERLGLDVVVLPDHLSYRAGGEGDYVRDDQPVGVRESLVVMAALAAATTTINIGHSVINAPYRSPTMLAHAAAALTDISGRRYSLGIGAGNSFEYDQLGVEADHRVARLEECLQILSGLLRDGYADVDGTYWHADRAELALGPTGPDAPPIIVAAGGPRTMRAAARHGDGWNGWCPTDPDDDSIPHLLDLLDQSCADINRDPSTILRTGDVAVDPLDLSGARQRSIETLQRLDQLGLDEVRCYTVCEETNAARIEALEAYAEMVKDV